MPARVAIIGAGPCGISLLKAFQDAKAQLSQPVDVVCFEKQGDWGGMWNLTWQTGLDQHGEPVHTGMYRHLYSNGPKECIEYPDYTFDEHFKRPIESFPRREKIHEYILARAEKSNIRHNIRFNTVMKYVKYDSSKEKFTATAFSFDSSKTFVEDFDYVIVATSHFSTPQLASIQGLNEFPGRILHSHDFRDACQFTGQDVLVVGNSSSGEDIALQLYKFGSRFVTITYRSMRTDLTWPPGIEEAPPLLHLEGSFAHFSDGKRKSYDAIILCTGYIYHFPFLDDNLRLESTNRYYPSLYKGVLFPTLPKLAYMGMQNLYFTLTLFEAQAWYIRDMILGRLVVPDAANRASSIVEWQTREASLSGHAVFDMDVYFVPASVILLM